MDWLRLWHDMPNDPKWTTIARKSGEPISLVIAMYVHMLVDASRNVTRGHVTVTPEDLASALNVTDEQVTAVLNAMQGRVIEDCELLGWNKRQPKREDFGNPETGAKSAAQRQAESRERKRLAKLAAESDQSNERCHDESRNVTTEERRLEEIREDKSNTRHAVVNDDVVENQNSSVSRQAAACMVIKSEGIGSVNPQHPDLIALIEQGADVGQFAAAAKVARGKGKGFAYLLGVVKGQMADAALLASTAQSQPMPGARAQPLTFAERDRIAGMQRWEESSNQRHPDLPAEFSKFRPTADVIDITPSNFRISQ
jgi:hypothetical protein